MGTLRPRLTMHHWVICFGHSKGATEDCQALGPMFLQQKNGRLRVVKEASADKPPDTSLGHSTQDRLANIQKEDPLFQMCWTQAVLKVLENFANLPGSQVHGWNTSFASSWREHLDRQHVTEMLRASNALSFSGCPQSFSCLIMSPRPIRPNLMGQIDR